MGVSIAACFILGELSGGAMGGLESKRQALEAFTESLNGTGNSARHKRMRGFPDSGVYMGDAERDWERSVSPAVSSEIDFISQLSSEISITIFKFLIDNNVQNLKDVYKTRETSRKWKQIIDASLVHICPGFWRFGGASPSLDIRSLASLVSNLGFSGDRTFQIQGVRHLEVSSNRAWDILSRSPRPLLGLKTLILSNVDASHPLAQGFLGVQFPALEKLCFKNSGAPIDFSASSGCSIKELSMQEGAPQMARLFKERVYPNLTHLTLESLDCPGSGAPGFFDGWGGIFPNLLSLTIWGNFGDTPLDFRKMPQTLEHLSCVSLSVELTNLRALKTLFLEDNGILSPQFQAWLVDLGNSPLEKVSVKENSLSGSGEALKIFLAGCPRLVELTLESTGLEAPDAVYLAEGLEWHTALRTVNFAANPMRSYGQASFRTMEAHRAKLGKSAIKLDLEFTN